jgi:hypothetical protein
MEISKYFKKNERRKDLIKRHALFLMILVCPFFVYALYLIGADMIRDAIYWIYTFNRVEYSKYSNYGESILGSFLFYLKAYGQSLSVLPILFWLINGIAWIGILLFSKKHKLPLIGIILLFFVLVFSGRTYYGFHAAPFLAVALFFGCYAAQLCLASIPTAKTGRKILCAVPIAVTIAVAVNGGFPYQQLALESVDKIKPLAQREIDFGTTPELARFIRAATTPDENIYSVPVEYWCLYYDTERNYPKGVSSSIVPWCYEPFREQYLSRMREASVIVYDPDTSVWGHRYGDFCGEIEAFLEEEYSQIPNGYQTVFIRNDCYEIVKERLIQAQVLTEFDYLPILFDSAASSTGASLPLVYRDALISGKTITQEFSLQEDARVGGVSIFSGTYARNNESNITVAIQDRAGKLLVQQDRNVRDFIDNEYNSIVFDHAVELEKGSYMIEISSDANAENCIALAELEDADPGNSMVVLVKGDDISDEKKNNV